MAKIALASRKKRDRKYIPGRRGKILFGGAYPVKVEVVEDRGRVGYRGRWIVRVRRIDPIANDDTTFEVPADELILTGK
jgi:hypothetical protein